MRLIVRVQGQLSAIVGYGPGANGVPMAIVVLDGGLTAISLNDIELLNVPHKLRKKLKKARQAKETTDVA